jgi:hypothetical protein
LRAICATRSRSVGMPSKRNFPLFFGIATCRTGNAVNEPSRSEERSSSKNGSTPMSSSTWRRVTASTPAVLAPWLLATRSHAVNNVAWSQIKLNRSPNRLSGSARAHRCSLRW